MATSNPKELKGWDKVVAWYARQSYAVGIIYSLGASVVIIGALFKIMHWPGAGIVLTAGMCTEAFLFVIGIFEKPHATYHWENIYPQLLGGEAHEVAGSKNEKVEKKEDKSVPTLSEQDFEQLKQGIANLGKTAGQLSELGKVAETTQKLTAKMDAAGTAADKFAASQDALTGASEKLGEQFDKVGRAYTEIEASAKKVSQSNEGLQKDVDAIGKQLSAINAVYELQLSSVKANNEALKSHASALAAQESGLKAQLDEIKAQTAAIGEQTKKIGASSASFEAQIAGAKAMEAEIEAALKASKEVAAAQQKLAAQVADLNKVYGNMLNALS